MKYIKFLIVIVLSSGCRQKFEIQHLDASFVMSENEVAMNKVVKFESADCDAIRHEWNFGDGEFSTVPNPTHKFSTINEYKVIHTVYGKNSSLVSHAEYLQVFSLLLNKIKLKKSNKPYWEFAFKIQNYRYPLTIDHYRFSFDSISNIYIYEDPNLLYKSDSIYQFEYEDYISGCGNDYRYFYKNQFNPFREDILANLKYTNKDPNSDFEVTLEFEKVIED